MSQFPPAGPARLLLALSLSLAVAGCDALASGPPLDVAEVNEPWNEMLDAVNALRAEGAVCGRERFPPAAALVWNPRLGGAALAHTLDMSENGHFEHEGTDGSDVGDRAARAGYAWRMVGENIARNQPSVPQVVADWAASPGHCRQMMDPRYVEMGAAERGRYWTQVFGLPR